METITFGYLVLVGLIALARCIFFSVCTKKVAEGKGKNETKAGWLGFFFGIWAWIAYISIGNPSELHNLYPNYYNEKGQSKF